MKHYLAMVPCEAFGMKAMPESEIRFVYMLQCADTKRIKIGVTDNVPNRIGEIQRMCATELRLVACIPSPGAALEGFFHRRFAKYRSHGEWFNPDACMVREIESYKDNWTDCTQGCPGIEAVLMSEFVTAEPMAGSPVCICESCNDSRSHASLVLDRRLKAEAKYGQA